MEQKKNAELRETISRNPFKSLIPAQLQSTSNEELSLDREGRFEEDFICKEVIGESASTIVVKCQNKLDGMNYAIKIQKPPLHEGTHALAHPLRQQL